jgi:23S rRNA (adenine2503-C2)-methyltransferase
MKRERNITAAEIVDQVRKVNTLCEATYDHPLTNIVYMGMGEPLLAYKEVIESIDRISSPDGLGMSAKRITISTAGISKAIRRLADDESKVNLALSLHAATDDKRDTIMPINESNNLDELMDALSYYYAQTGNRISYEYIAFQGFNDSIDDARALLRWCQRFPVRINIIEYNPIDGADFSASSEDQLDRFAGFLRKKGIMVTVRRSRGKDIDAACGQLANKE